jgi:hypothetical protein
MSKTYKIKPLKFKLEIDSPSLVEHYAYAATNCYVIRWQFDRETKTARWSWVCMYLRTNSRDTTPAKSFGDAKKQCNEHYQKHTLEFLRPVK